MTTKPTTKAAAKTPAAPAAPIAPELTIKAAVFTHHIAATVDKGFYRAGRHWPREGVEVDRAEFSDEQWSALEGEPKLTVKTL